MYPDKYFSAKKFQRLKRNTLFQSNEGNVCERRLSIFVTFLKIYPDKYFSAKKVSAFEIEYTLFIQRKEMNVKEM